MTELEEFINFSFSILNTQLFKQNCNDQTHCLQPYSSHAQSNGMCQRCVSVKLSLPVSLTCKMFDMCLCPLSLCTSLLLVSVKIERPEQGTFFNLFFGSYTYNHNLILFSLFLRRNILRLYDCSDVCEGF